jgi:predicted TPR repeat methyltransferase
LGTIFAETGRLLQPGGLLAFTTKAPSRALAAGRPFDRQTSDGFDVFSHTPAYLTALLDRYGFSKEKMMRCFVGEDIFRAWLVRKAA